MSVQDQIQKAFDRVENKILKQYHDLLKNHDWFSEYSDDPSVWEKGSLEFQQITQLAKTFDKDFTIFNLYAPDEYKIKLGDDVRNTLNNLDGE